MGERKYTVAQLIKALRAAPPDAIVYGEWEGQQIAVKGLEILTENVSRRTYRPLPCVLLWVDTH